METLAFPLEVKALSEAGTFTGLASTYGNLDLLGDVVEQGAFAETLKKRGSKRPLLWAHDQAQPLGLGELADTPAGLEVRGTLNLDVARAVEIHSLMKQGVIKALSIGFRTLKQRAEGAIHRLLAVDLFEVSLVVLAANEAALVESVKSAEEPLTIRSFEKVLRSIGLSRAEATAVASHGFSGFAKVAEQEAETEAVAWLRENSLRSSP